MKHKALAVFCSSSGSRYDDRMWTKENSPGNKNRNAAEKGETVSDEDGRKSWIQRRYLTRKEASDAKDTKEAVLDTSKELTGIHHAQINVKDYGEIQVELDADTAPITVTNFVKLAQDGILRRSDLLAYYRTVLWFRAGSSGNGTGGSDQNIKGEFSNNGVENNISHTRGVISMARAMDPDSASSQFFIVHEDSTFLDGDYAGFGHVTEGMDVVDAICKDAKPTDDNGTIKPEEELVIREHHHC